MKNPNEIDIETILKCLPHRYPFLLVDKVIEIDLEKDHIIAVKNVTFNEPFFQGHFPGKPIMPGVMILEALAQAGGVLMFEKGYPQLKVLASIRNAKFRKVVKPGDVLTLEVWAIHLSARGGKLKGEAKVDGELATEAEIVFGMLSTPKGNENG